MWLRTCALKWKCTQVAMEQELVRLDRLKMMVRWLTMRTKKRSITLRKLAGNTVLKSVWAVVSALVWVVLVKLYTEISVFVKTAPFLKRRKLYGLKTKDYY